MKSFNFGEADAMKRKKLAEEEGMPSSIDIHVPIEVVEGILSRLPVKSLIRFKSTCKLWHTIISDPRFCRVHYDTTHNNNLYWVRSLDIVDSYRLVKIKNGEVKTEWRFKFPFDEFVIPYRTCNGLVLMVRDRTRVVTLWNPSIRKHYCWIKTPPEHKDDVRTYGFYYDPIIDDYKIAVISHKYYTIYSCKSASWGVTKPYPSMPAGLRPDEGSNVDGSSSFYWVDKELGEIVCFDFRDEQLSKLPLPTGVNLDAYCFHLGTMLGCLCWLGRRRGGMINQLWVMEKHNHSWRELIHIEKWEPSLHLATPYILTNEDTVVLGLDTKITPRITKFLIYCLRDKRLKDFSCDIGKDINYMLPYSESLNFPVQEIILQRKQGIECDASG